MTKEALNFQKSLREKQGECRWEGGWGLWQLSHPALNGAVLSPGGQRWEGAGGACGGVVFTPASSCGFNQPWGATGSFPVSQPLPVGLPLFCCLRPRCWAFSLTCAPLSGATGLTEASPGRWAAGDPHKGPTSWCGLLTAQGSLIGMGCWLRHKKLRREREYGYQRA